MRILVTGFGPFGNYTENPAGEALSHLPACVAGAEVHTALLPVSFQGAAASVAALIDALRPDAVLSLGLAALRSGLHVERAALNLLDARIPDNDGAQPCDVPAAPDGPAAYLATLPTRAIVDALQAAGFEAVLSYTAGTYVCNAAMYAALHHIKIHNYATVSGFIHVPACEPKALVPQIICVIETICAALDKARS